MGTSYLSGKWLNHKLKNVSYQPKTHRQSWFRQLLAERLPVVCGSGGHDLVAHYFRRHSFCQCVRPGHGCPGEKQSGHQCLFYFDGAGIRHSGSPENHQQTARSGEHPVHFEHHRASELSGQVAEQQPYSSEPFRNRLQSSACRAQYHRQRSVAIREHRRFLE